MIRNFIRVICGCFDRTFLLLQLESKSLFPVGDVSFVAGRIEERCGLAEFEPFILLFHIEVTAVSAEEYVAGQ